MRNRNEKNMQISGMNCAHCAAKVEKALSEVPGVKKAKVDLKKARGTVKFDESQVTETALVNAVTEAGYQGVFE
ncbi:copper chaperone CopZ [Enterococcus sp. RIT-PI-f]|uniref:copper chaperone CopZ n=1 Tax=Enterococcus sp. RIT-PI-f TaxID=1690244 RepID=UPI0035623859